MAIRPAREEDVDALVDVAAASRFARQAWEPELWGDALTAEAGLEPLVIGARVIAAAAALVVEEHEGIVAWATARRGWPGQWVVDDLLVDAGAPPAVVSGLLAALAGRAHADSATGLWASAARADHSMTAALSAAGLRRRYGVRRRAVGPRTTRPPRGVRSMVAADEIAVSGWWPPEDGAGAALGVEGPRARDGDGLVVDDRDGAIAAVAVRTVARVSAPILARRPRVVASRVGLAPGTRWADHGERLLDGLEWLVAGSETRDLLVVVPTDDEEAHLALDGRGAGWPIDLWWLGAPFG